MVEDNDLNLKLFKDLLETKNIYVVESRGGEKVMELVADELPDLILMDIQLHGMSGFELIEKIKSDDDLKHIPIIAVTAFAMKDDRDRIMESGCEDYIAKPISIGSFLETVEQYLKAGSKKNEV